MPQIELDDEQTALLEAINRLDPAIFEKWAPVAGYWQLDEAKMLDELRSEDCTPMRSQFLRGALAMLADMINFPALVNKERKTLLNPE